MQIYSKLIMVTFVLMFGLISIAAAQSDVPSKEDQIEAATSAAPQSMQKEASVMGYDEQGELVKLRKGTNPLLCISDNPRQDNFHVSCYHKDLEPFMSRGRELRNKGFSRTKVDSLRRVEIENGTLKLPQKPMALYSLNGSADAYDYKMDRVRNAKPLYVIYIPYATQASTGLSKKPASEGAPWIMEPGTPWAHIMVMTGRDIGGGIN